MAFVGEQKNILDMEKLTYEIFSILESNFLFNSETETPIPTPPESPIKRSPNTLCSGGRLIRILSIDAASDGGILAAVSLVHLEKSLRKQTGDPDAMIPDFFDLATGSGTGGILAAMLFAPGGLHGRPRFSADQALTFLLANRTTKITISISSPNNTSTTAKSSSSKGGIFCKMFSSNNKNKSSSSSTNTARLVSVRVRVRDDEDPFNKLMGDLTVRDAIKPLLIPCYDFVSGSPFMFSRSDALESDVYNFLIKDVCAATTTCTAAVVEMKSLDCKKRIVATGGVVAMGNPAAAAITHVINNKREFPFAKGVEDLLVMSLGSSGEVAAYNYGGKKAAAAPIISDIARIAGEGAIDMVDQSVSMAMGEKRATNYVRIQTNVVISEKIKKREGADPVSVAEKVMLERNVDNVMFCGKKLSDVSNAEKLELFTTQLILEEQRRKTCAALPTVVIKQLPVHGHHRQQQQH